MAALSYADRPNPFVSRQRGRGRGRFDSGRVARPSLFRLGLVLALAVAACGPAAPASVPAATGAPGPAATGAPAATPKPEDPVVVVGAYAGTARQDLEAACLVPFTKDTGIQVRYVDGFTGVAKVRAQIDSGKPEVDVTFMNGTDVPAALAGNYLQPIDYGQVDKSQLTPNQYEHTFGKYGITYDVFATVMAYNAKKWPNPATAPKTWADFWDTRQFPGPRAMEGFRAVFNLAAASRALDVAPERTFPMDLDRLFKKLDEIKRGSLFFPTTTDQAKLMLTGEADVSLAYPSRVDEVKQAGANWKLVPETYIRTQGTLWVIPRDVVHPKNAARLIGYCAGPKSTAAWAIARKAAPSNLKSLDLMPKELVEISAVAPKYKPTTVVVDDEWYGTRLVEIEKRWDAALKQ